VRPSSRKFVQLPTWTVAKCTNSLLFGLLVLVLAGCGADSATSFPEESPDPVTEAEAGELTPVLPASSSTSIAEATTTEAETETEAETTTSEVETTTTEAETTTTVESTTTTSTTEVVVEAPSDRLDSISLDLELVA